MAEYCGGSKSYHTINVHEVLRTRIIAFLLVASFVPGLSQSLLNDLDSGNQEVNYTIATFKGQRLVNGQTVETIPAGDLQFIFAHRFETINQGIYEFFGLDQAYVRIGFEYGINDDLGVGFGRNSVDKTLDAYLRYKVIRQKSGSETFPFTATLFASAAARMSPRNKDLSSPIDVNDRLAYTTQVLLARKVSPAFSFQLMPTIVHKNRVDESIEKNTQPLVGVGGRIKISKSAAITAEYYHRFDVPGSSPYYNPFGIGIDIETGGHVFQLVFTNTRGLTERAYLTETAGDFFDGDIHFGFNVTRMFSFKKK